MYVPPGFGTVFPYMVVDDPDRLASFLTDVFDATEAGRTVMPGGRIANIRMSVGSSTFMISQAAPDGMAAMAGAYYVYVNDVDRAFDKAIAEGAEQYFAPADMPYKDRQAGVKDAFGNYWFISKRLVEEPYDS
jgi:PhnB protein